jgi:hypothetical protein
MEKVGIRWVAHAEHGELLRSFIEVGGLQYCPEEVDKKILKWLVLTYLGEPGGVTRFGNVRHVFYSDTAVSYIPQIIKDSRNKIDETLRSLSNDRVIAQLCKDQHIAKRFEDLLDLLENKK